MPTLVMCRHGESDWNRQNRELFGKALFGRLGFGNRGDRHPEAKCLGALFKNRHVAEQHESGDGLLTLRQPGSKRNVGTDPGGIAHGEC